LTNFVKKTESTLNACQQSSHPLVLQQKEKIEKAQRKRGGGSDDSHLKKMITSDDASS